MATSTVTGSKVAGRDEHEQGYRALVKRIGGYRMSEEARARILAQIEAI